MGRETVYHSNDCPSANDYEATLTNIHTSKIDLVSTSGTHTVTTINKIQSALDISWFNVTRYCITLQHDNNKEIYFRLWTHKRRTIARPDGELWCVHCEYRNKSGHDISRTPCTTHHRAPVYAICLYCKGGWLTSNDVWMGSWRGWNRKPDLWSDRVRSCSCLASMLSMSGCLSKIHIG